MKGGVPRSFEQSINILKLDFFELNIIVPAKS